MIVLSVAMECAGCHGSDEPQATRTHEGRSMPSTPTAVSTATFPSAPAPEEDIIAAIERSSLSPCISISSDADTLVSVARTPTGELVVRAVKNKSVGHDGDCIVKEINRIVVHSTSKASVETDVLITRRVPGIPPFQIGPVHAYPFRDGSHTIKNGLVPAARFRYQ